ncbi:MAG: alpha/beta hydrolase [Lachnospiraceae bacterium]|nr:alpha/beta hydrolase [Lachnospiraceae bacterium]
MNEKKLAVILPGIGYHKDKPLLYYAAKLAEKLGYKVIFVEYHDLPEKVKGNREKMIAAFDLAFAQTREYLKSEDYSRYEDVVFIGKSIGTAVESAYVKQYDVPARQIWYTPVEATFSKGSKDVLAFIGDADPWSDVAKVKQMAAEQGIKLHSYEACNHSLECEDILKNIRILQDVMEKTAAFLK